MDKKRRSSQPAEDLHQGLFKKVAAVEIVDDEGSSVAEETTTTVKAPTTSQVEEACTHLLSVLETMDEDADLQAARSFLLTMQQMCATEKSKLSNMAQPIQPIGLDEHGVLRFKKNAIVADLVDSSNLNDISRKVKQGQYSNQDYVHLMQLVGYSVSGFGDLSSVQKYPEVLKEVDSRADAFIQKYMK